MLGAEVGILNARLRDFVALNARKLNDAIDPLASRRFEYFGLRTVYDRYLLRHPTKRQVIETPQYFFMRIACALGGNDIAETLELYRLLSSLEYIASSPTLFNAGTTHEQLSLVLPARLADRLAGVDLRQVRRRRQAQQVRRRHRHRLRRACVRAAR